MKNYILTFLGAVFGMIVSFLGGFTYAVKALLTFMTIDYITGIMVAMFFKNSTKTKSGSLQSIAGFKGICKKVCILFAVGISLKLDILLNVNFIHHAVTCAYCVNEVISITENLGLMGLYIPKPLKDAIDVLAKKEEEK